jgi:cell division protein FtsW
MSKKRNFTKKKGSKSLFTVMMLLLCFGLIMITNATSVSSSNLYGSPYRFAILQLGWVIAGLICFIIFYNLDYKKISKVSRGLFIFTLISLVILAIAGVLPCSSSAKFPFAPCINGANRWLYINPPPLPEIPFLGVVGFQPGELAKLAIVLYMSSRLSLISQKGGKKVENQKESLVAYLKISVLVAGLIILQPNMSTATLVFVLGTIVYFSSGAPIKPIIGIFIGAFILGVLFMVSSKYRLERLKAMLPGGGDSESSYHVTQALVALGSGGISGVGFGQSKQKYQYLPEVASDSIFAIIGEEFGFIGTVTVIILYFYLIYMGFKIADNSEDMLGKLIAVGISSWFGIQFFINVASMTKIIPMTGVPIPLISYGGSSMIFSLTGLGILANIQKQSELY